MTIRFFNRAARGVLAGTIALGATLGFAASPADANFVASDKVCKPGPTPTITRTVSPGLFYEHEHAKVTVKLSNPSCSEVRVEFSTLPGSAKPWEDYYPQYLTLTFKPGETTHVRTIWPVNDNVQEGIKLFTLSLANASGATIPSISASADLGVDGVEPQ